MRTPSTGNAALPPDSNVPPGKNGAEPSRAKTKADVDGRPAPRLPHERDESSDTGTGAPSELMHRARKDVEHGKRPTDKGEATDATYNGGLRGPTPGRERD